MGGPLDGDATQRGGLEAFSDLCVSNVRDTLKDRGEGRVGRGREGGKKEGREAGREGQRKSITKRTFKPAKIPRVTSVSRTREQACQWHLSREEEREGGKEGRGETGGRKEKVSRSYR